MYRRDFVFDMTVNLPGVTRFFEVPNLRLAK